MASKMIKRRTNKPCESTVPFCDCMGYQHIPWTNCIKCGYIICQQYYNHFANSDNKTQIPCPRCNNPCSPPYSSEDLAQNGFPEDALKAYRMKDRLLSFDREHAKRTVVYDAQGDYYTSGGTAWLTEKERQRLIEIEKKKMKQKSKSKLLQKVNIEFDIAGRKVAVSKVDDLSEEDDVVEDYDDCGNHKDYCHYDEEVLDEITETSGFVNTNLMYQSTKAAEVYRFIKQRYS